MSDRYSSANPTSKTKMSKDWDFVSGSKAEVGMEQPVLVGKGQKFRWKMFLKKSYVSLQIDPVKNIVKNESGLGKAGESIRTAIIEQLIPFKPEGLFIHEVESYSVTFDKTLSYREIAEHFLKRVDELLTKREP